MLAICIPLHLGAQGKPFTSPSDGSDGDLNITAPGVTYFDPVALKLQPRNNNIFQFKTIKIASGSVLKLSESRLHGPVFFLVQGDVVINGAIDMTGDDSPGPTATAAEQGLTYAGSGGYSGGLGGIHGDSNHQALPGNGPAGGAPGDINVGGSGSAGGFSTDRFLVPLTGGSGGGGMNGNGQFGPQGGAGAGALLIASSTTITLDGDNKQINSRALDGRIEAWGGNGSNVGGCGGAGGAVRLVANTIQGNSSYYIQVDGGASGGACKGNGAPGLARLEANTITFGTGNFTGAAGLYSVPFALNLPNVPLPVISVTSIAGKPVNANPFSFPDATIDTSSAVPVVITATNVPIASKVTLYVFSDGQPDQSIPVTLSGNSTSSAATVQVNFPPGGSRGFVKAIFQ